MNMTIRGLLGRVLVSLGTVIAGFVPLNADLSPSHVFNPEWPAHAKFHEVWLLSTGGLLALVALYFIWLYRSSPRLGIALAAVLGSVQLGGFFIAAATASLYGGKLDPVMAAAVPALEIALGMPMNVIGFGAAWLCLWVGTVLALGVKRAHEPA
jgi:hypothetical protein